MNLKGKELGEALHGPKLSAPGSSAHSHASHPSTPGSDNSAESQRVPPSVASDLQMPRSSAPVDMTRQPSTASVAATVGTEYSPHPNAGPLENGFPFPNSGSSGHGAF